MQGTLMNTYECHKVVRAKSMSRLEYNTLRGWVVPFDEDGADSGYLVEYTDGGTGNHKDYVGYISWSPKAQFDAGYTEVV